jgi:branched-chain amino acid transport system substrate-binding protein
MLAAVGLVVGACGSSSHNTSGQSAATTGGSAGTGKNGPATGTPYVIGFITSQTGRASSSYADSERGAQARVNALNATGGINGHPVQIVMYDDTSTPSGNQTAANLILTKNVVGVIDDTSFAFGGYQALKAAGMPVVGASVDGPEWGQSYNMFSVIPPTQTPINGRSYTYTSLVNTFKLLGIKKLGGVGYNIASVTQAADQMFQLSADAGIAKCYNNDTISFGVNDFTAVALAVRSAGCDGVYVPMLLTSVISIAQEFKGSGVNAKLVIPTAYDQNVQNNPSALNALAGHYTTAQVDMTNPSPGAQTMLNSLRQYAQYTSGIVNLNVLFAYLSADLLIKGIQMAGPSPTPSKIVSSLRTIGSYDGGGILPTPVTFQGFGTPAMFPPKSCSPIFMITTKGYAPFNDGKPVCGDLVSTKAGG